jgi:small subunit ribosomal protein S20
VANIKSQIKRNRQNETRRVRNKAARTSLKTDAKRVREAAFDGDQDSAQEALRVATRQLDKATSKGILHRRTAARRKSRLARTAASAGAEE